MWMIVVGSGPADSCSLFKKRATRCGKATEKKKMNDAQSKNFYVGSLAGRGTDVSTFLAASYRC